ncbi:MAG TPA: phenylalanine--tRNA ligase subunit beta [Burkholderiaceae bacterium]|nr:phenylalanine--tRNA ligase subunit beta [Burkholderiaceae bacterium]
MLIPESWLRSFADPDLNTQELAHTLTMAGLEVEDIDSAAPAFSGVVVARIKSVDPHPDADRLKVCRVDDGSGATLQIVCGAPNVRAGMLAPLARVGAALPGGLKIKKARMRGQESFGMLCSGQELGLPQDHDGLLELAPDLAAGQCLREALDLDEACLTLKLTPNRADCLSIHGVARELSALTGVSLSLPDMTPVMPAIMETLPVHIKAPDLCGRFAGRVIRGVNARAATPDWMARRLLRSGQRPVSVLVDISNYVMLELGRPTHVFDLDKLEGELTVQWGSAGERLTLLNDQEVTLTPEIGVITSGDTPQSLAGIMGGAASSVTLDTRNIYLEGAFWWPEAIMGRTRDLKIESEASHRFERGVDAVSIAPHLERVTQLVLDICGGQAGPLDDQTLALPERPPVAMRLARCNKVLGIDISITEAADVFTRLGLPFDVSEGVFTVTPPSYRFDLIIEEDLIEEVARIYGFERIPDHPPVAAANMLVQSETRDDAHAVRARMVALDYQEVINFSFVREQWETDYANNSSPIRLLNPIASQLAVMRSSLLGGLLANIEHNAHHRQTRVRVFEVGRVFLRDPQAPASDLAVAGVRQPTRVAGAAWGPAWPEQWGAPSRHVDFYDVKNDIQTLFGSRASQLRYEAAAHPALHPGRSARVLLGEQPVGWLGEIHPQWLQETGLRQAPVVFELELEALLTVPFPQPRPASRQPVVVRDLAVWLPIDVSFQSLLDTLDAARGQRAELAIVRHVNLFDVWRDASHKGNEKSFALRFWLQHPDATLEEAAIDACMGSLMNVLETRHQARPRT